MRQVHQYEFEFYINEYGCGTVCGVSFRIAIYKKRWVQFGILGILGIAKLSEFSVIIFFSIFEMFGISNGV